MEQYGNNESNDMQRERARLYEQLRICDEKVHSLEKEIASTKEFIDKVADSKLDREGLLESMGVVVLQKQLHELKKKQNMVFEAINALESSQFGEEIPRGEDGKLEIPWEKIYLTQVEKQVNELFGDDN